MIGTVAVGVTVLGAFTLWGVYMGSMNRYRDFCKGYDAGYQDAFMARQIEEACGIPEGTVETVEAAVEAYDSRIPTVPAPPPSQLSQDSLEGLDDPEDTIIGIAPGPSLSEVKTAAYPYAVASPPHDYRPGHRR